MASLIDEAFALLGEAKELEKEATTLSDDPPRTTERAPSWAVLERSAAKYNEACYLMKRHIRSGSVQNGQVQPEEAARLRQLLVENVDLYERHADDLLKEVKGLKLADEQQQRQRQRSSTGTRDMRDSASSWEASHGSQLHPAVAGNPAQPVVSNDSATRQESRHAEKEKLQLEATQSADKANRLLGTALDHDEQGDTLVAIDRYLQAVSCFSHAIQLLSGEKGGETATASGQSSRQSADSSTSATQKEATSLRRKRQLALDRVAKLKHLLTAPAPGPSAPAQPTVDRTTLPSRADKLTPYEVKVLKWSSRIASGLFLPWSDEEARTYEYRPARPWSDPDGLLPLSDKQKERGCRWARPSEIAAMRGKSASSACTIAMIHSITPYTIKQHCVSDCSFIAGLCICSNFERRFKRRLVSSLIYPQDPKTGMPVYNPQGIYMVKLWFNGVARRVLVDDLLPVDAHGNLLCSHTTTLGKANANVLELWVPILEKAFMKLSGGYSFPGSNSGVDLFCLTGWIPERIFFPEDPSDVKDFETPVERAWDRLYSANSYGDCLITLSTSTDLTEEQAEQVGLFTGHAYAVLGVIQTSNGTKLLQLKNPWASKGWKGRFSPRDTTSWSDPDFCAEVGYDATTASHYDDGVFWISWDDVLCYFRNMHLSWSTDPDLFRYRTSVHGFWGKDVGPVDDSYNVGDNPQYTVTLSDNAIKNKATLWILLSRHVNKQEQEGAEVSDFLTLHLHQIQKPNQRVWYPDSRCVLTGAYTNNQHSLSRYDVTGSDRFLSIVLSQYRKSNDLGYTLSCYCTEEFKLGHPEKQLPISRQLSGSWKLRDGSDSFSLSIGTAGGPPGKGSFGSNPQWSIDVPAEGARLQIKCLAPKELPVNIILARSQRHGTNLPISKRLHHLYEEPIIDTGAYRHGFAVSETVFVSAGFYTLVASTFEVGQVGNFQLQVFSSKEVNLKEIPGLS